MNLMKNDIQKIEQFTWLCVDAYPRKARDDWEWRKKYIGMIGHIIVHDIKDLDGHYHVKFITDDVKGFVTSVNEFVLDDDRLKVITDRSVYMFYKKD